MGDKMQEAKDIAKKKLELYQKGINDKVTDWYNFSTTPRTETEIKERVLRDKKYNEESCCISYICKFSKLSEEMIDWLDENTKLPEKATREGIHSKVDWDYISSYQVLSEEFIERHAANVNWTRIFQFQKLSDEFRSKHLKELKLELEKEQSKED